MRKILLFFTSLIPVFCYAQNETSIPVISENNETQLHKSESEKKFDKSKEIIENLEVGNINQESINTSVTPGSAPSSKSFADVANRISSAQVERYGGEAGILRVRLRGARAFEPSYYFNGFPLTGAGSGEQNLSLLPISFISRLDVYPDTAPFWLSSMGIAGDIDIQSCRREDCFTFGKDQSLNALKLTTRVGSFGYRQVTGSYSLKINKQSEIFSSLEYTTSKEDYLVLNNNNSILHANQGNYEPLQNNDFQKVAGGMGLSTFFYPIGKINLDFVFANQNLGVPGEIGSVSNTRLKRNIFLGTLRSEKIFSNSGLQWYNQLAALYNKSQSENLNGSFARQASNSDNYSLQAKSWLILPTEIIQQEQTGLSFEVLQYGQNTDTLLPASSNDSQYKSNTEASRLEFRPSAFESIVFPIDNDFSISASANGWFSFAQGNSNISCNYPSIKGQCSSQFHEQEKPLWGYTFSLQSKYHLLIYFARYSQSMRRPYLAEFYGAPGGILPNVQLLPESSKKIETGVRLPWFELGYFHAKDSNLIFLQQTNPMTAQYQNIENSYRDGIYLNTDYYILKHWKTSISYQYLVAKMIKDNDTTEIPRSPRHYINATTNLEEIEMGNVYNYQSKFGAYANMSWQSLFYLDYANINKMEVPPIYNTGVSFSFSNKELAQNYTISLDVYNILNETFSTISNSTGFVQQVQSNGYIGYPPPGRRIYLSLIGEI